MEDLDMRLVHNLEFTVLDFNPNKVKKICLEDVNIIRKKTDEKELTKLKEASNYLLKNPIFIDNIKVCVADVLAFDGNFLYLKYCEGINLEKALRMCNVSLDDKYPKLINGFIRKCFGRGFLWGDLAPRNMVFNQDKKILFIFDFERDLKINDCSQEKIGFSDFLRHYSLEEFSCIAGFENRKIILNGVIFNRSNKFYRLEEITSLRKKHLLKSFFGCKSLYSSSEIQYIEDLMSFLLTPFYVEGMFRYPIEMLDVIKNFGGYHEHTIAIRELSICHSSQERFNFLKRALRRFCINEIKG